MKTKSRPLPKSQSDINKFSKEMKKITKDIQGKCISFSAKFHVEKIETIDTTKEVFDLKERINALNAKCEDYRLK
jgi:hypothetical protein